jgi:ketosteroid isomerase-like protein
MGQGMEQIPANESRPAIVAQATDQGGQRTQDPEVARLIDLTNDWTDAITRIDRSKLDELMASDFKLYSWSGQQLATKSEWLDNLFNHIKITNYTLEKVSPRIYDDFAIVTSEGEWAGSLDEKPFDRKTIVLDTWRKINGQWQVATRTTYVEDIKSPPAK